MLEQLPAVELSNAPVRRVWYRTSLFNAFVIGIVGFTAPGLWDDMNDLGAGGGESPYVVNAANALVFALMGIFCILGGPIANRIGLKYTLLLGAIGYPVYSAGLYTNNRFGNVWFVLVGSVACGILAGLFWASEGAVALGYPEPGKRGLYSNIWLWFRIGGPLLGGAISYLIFIALQCLAIPSALALSPPDKVQRADGSKVVVRAEKTFKAELVALWKTMGQRKFLLLLPVFWVSQFNQYSRNFETFYFGIRARALIGFVNNFPRLISSQIISHLLDYNGWSVKKRITIGFYYIIFLHILAWSYAWAIQSKYTHLKPVYDWTDEGFTEGFFVLILWAVSQQALLNWVYYLVSSSTGNISELTRYAGILRGHDSFGEAVSYGLSSRKWYGGRVPMAVNTILLILAIYPT